MVTLSRALMGTRCKDCGRYLTDGEWLGWLDDDETGGVIGPHCPECLHRRCEGPAERPVQRLF